MGHEDDRLFLALGQEFRPDFRPGHALEAVPVGVVGQFVIGGDMVSER
jgi:hypothetical protein